MLKLKMPECFVTESEIIGEPCQSLTQDYAMSWNTLRRVSWSQLVRDQDGDVVFVHAPVSDLASRLSRSLGRPFFPVRFVAPNLRGTSGQGAIGLPEGETLNDNELAAVLMAAWTDHQYHPGILRSKSELVGDHVREYTGLPAVFHDKQFAMDIVTVLNKVFKRAARPVRDGNRWGVAVTDKGALDGRTIAEIVGIHRLLGQYDITPKEKARCHDPFYYEWHRSHDFADLVAKQAKSEDDRDEQRQRIEDAVSAILERLGGPAGAAPDSVLSPVGEAFADMHKSESTPEDKLAATIEEHGGLMPTIDASRKRPAAKSAKARAKGKKKAA